VQDVIPLQTVLKVEKEVL